MEISGPLSIRSSREGVLHRLTPVGELDLATVPMLEAAFDAVCADDSAAMVVVDLTQLGFIDSTGIQSLLRMYAACADGDRLRVVNGSRQVERLLDVSGVRDRLPIISSDDDPLAPLPSMPLRRGHRG
ncbi:MAG TPA: STAS domain-containing protein [Solirubrobacteraceae bacterium]|nr:STAS domain-containing protein [Solirubrobacteraceae bacterium]